MRFIYIIDKIKKTPINELFGVKLKNYIYRRFQRFCWRILGKIPHSLSWKSQWYAYKKICNNYLNWTYDLSELLPANNPCLNSKNVFVYWNDGIELAPDLVQKCHSQLIHNIPNGYNLHVITEENIGNYVNFPQFIYNKLNKKIIGQAHFSDMLRTALLYFYGGIWMDATCLLTQPIPQKILKSELFMFQANKMNLVETYPPIKNSNWFIATSGRGNFLLKRVLEILLNYWYNNNSLIHYYLYHLTVSALVDTNEKCATIWKEIPYVCNMDPHVLWFDFFEDYTTIRWENAIESCWVHKLSYKFNKDVLNCEKENMIQHFMKVF